VWWSVVVARACADVSCLDPEARAEQIVMCWPPLDPGPIRVGGILLWGAQFADLDRLGTRIRQYQARATVPLLVAADIEGGVFDRLAGHPAFPGGIPSARALGGLPDDQIEAWGLRVGAVMADLGINVDLAPVLDVAGSGAIADQRRSYSDDPARVASAGAAFARGLRAAGIATIGKHFPGLGDLGDTDRHPVSAPWSAEGIALHERVFAAVAPELDGVLLSHARYPSVDPRPAYASPRWVARATSVAGLVLTDDLAAARRLGLSAEPELDAFRAGADVLVTSQPPERRDVAGPIAELARHDPEANALLDDAVGRVLALKARLGLIP
jgi:beta-N-acetylhexosaminidase